ncbi:Putative L-aminoadipate-semialdehyde dehydrogenase large subunit [[Torrubiella] hemipterigena]|uniref:Alpha-aminoadipate reductase n=1 Tax=[Torrubiella] hemipterigena TaxID=1531966 RepID=A0A0A1T9I1_9HYPO|nr:Putative L-aminoadipate-semialdehyde dehydrogenase large subunit [[Torrubiella] hemipterigena]
MGLPDPTTDLDWSGYIGAIHEIFAANALKNPDAPCVTETASSTTPERRFTYRQIYEASNVLANQLSEAGITNGDVVMIFAYRSVELIIAFMGTLAAGATITVLDPAYPPARQQIYLEVSQPKALITIGRARDENGTFAPRVQKYIDEELSLKIRVPELRMSDAGQVTGGEVDGKEVFTNTEAKRSSPPNVLVGPDSTSVLSFTSGTTSTPKGVLSRHYSLAKYFPWMARTFNWTSETKFACLSGISHDPIQRDIFSPLFMGSELIIPARENIAHERLAEWFRDYKPNAVHLTPAMGQILCGGAKAEFPSLKWVLYVGDILTKKDCAGLRKLAPNADICAAYGTTETNRSVSYYHIRSHSEDPNALDKFGDIVPAGRGIENVQLLVVNREDPTKLCGVGEVGEIYLRAAVYGYLNDAEKTNEKFINNWFVDNQKWVDADNAVADLAKQPWRKYYKGPRDRIYRSGDLGHYLDDSGNTAITGRADDQVKVRGFRIELNEIDSNLRGHQLVRECKTLLRRDRNEEPTLVSYVVPEDQEWTKWLAERGLDNTEEQGTEIGPVLVYTKRYRPMQAEVRDHLKSRLPIQAVPTYFIFLKKMPLNPNGKIDSPALPFPDAALIEEEATEDDLKRWEGLSSTEKEVAEQWATLINGLNAKTLHPESDFFESGGHSLLAQQLLLNLRKQMGANVTISSLYSNSTLGSLSTQIDRLREGKEESVAPEDSGAAYAESLDKLLETLDAKYQTADPAALSPATKTTVFVTGATGFLGSYIVKDLLQRENIHVVAHVRGTKGVPAALERLQKSLRGYSVWQDAWASRLSAVIGDLAQPHLGIDDATWKTLTETVDVVIHNGALVHWVKQYKHLERANVHSTIEALSLCNQGKPKLFSFISSTSVLDTDHYIDLSHQQTSTGQGAVMEADDMEGSRVGLGTGYGQSKWVSEQLVREAGRRGLLGSVVRPGYILGDAATGVVNNDDFLIRMLKGCIQLSSRPHIINTINAVPVGHVSTVAVAASLNPVPASTSGVDKGVHVVHVTAHPRLRMNEYLSILSYYGYDVPEVDYDSWKGQLETFVSAGSVQKDEEQSALMPLFHMATNNLPTTTRAPELDDRNAVAVLKADADRWTGVDESAGEGISRETVGRFLRFLAETGFLAWPTIRGRELPAITEGVVENQAKWGVGGRGGVA